MPIYTEAELKQKVADGEVSAISLDTAIFDTYGCNLDFTILRKLDQFKITPVSVLFSEIIIKEIKSHIVRDAKEATSKLKKALRAQSKRWKTDLDFSTLPATLSLDVDPEDAAKEQIDEYLEFVEGTIIPACNSLEISKELLRRYFSTEAPFEGNEKKKNEFPDAFALISIEEWAKENKTLVLCVSKDKGWVSFAEQSDFLICLTDLNEALSLFNTSGKNLAQKAIAMLKEGSAPDFDAEIERAFEYVLDGLEFYADGTAPLSFESEAMSAIFQYIIPESITEPIIISTYADDITFTFKVEAHIDFEAFFSFHVKDGIDKDYVSLGGTTYETDAQFVFDVAVTMTRSIEDQPEVFEVSVVKKSLDVDFGFVQPFPDENPEHEKY